VDKLIGRYTEGEEDESEGRAVVMKRAVTDPGIADDAGMVKDGSTDGPDAGMTYDTNRFHPFGMTMEDILSGEREKELARLQEMYREYYDSMQEEEDIKDLTKALFLDPRYHDFQTVMPLSWSSGSSSPVTDGFQRAYRYLGNSADDQQNGAWFHELNGITNDSSYWYFCRNITDVEFVLYKENYSTNLDESFTPDDSWQDTINDCWHCGDIDYYDRGDFGIIVVPLENCSGGLATFAFFKAGNLTPLAFFEDEGQYLNGGAPWVAVREGKIYSSRGGENVTGVVEYTVNWNLIPSNPDQPVELDYDEFVIDEHVHYITNVYYSSERWQDNRLHHMQGGDFSNDGSLFYSLTGLCTENCGECSPREIKVFLYDADDDWSFIKRSSSTAMPFRYQTQPCDTNYEEPEGITYYDVNTIAGYSQNMLRGEVMAILLNNDWVNYDNIYLKHYTSIIDVNTTDGINYALYDRWDSHGAWKGSILELEAGTYEETIDIDSEFWPIKIISKDGTAAIHP